MLIPGLKKKYGRTLIYQTSDQYGPIEVADSGSFRSLHFGTFPKQSETVKTEPYVPVLEYAEAMLAGLLFVHNPATVYFMGLGAGTLPYFIHECYSEAKILISEIRPVVYQVAKHFFGFPVHQNIRLLFNDGYKFLNETRFKFSLIFIDAFSADGLADEIDKQDLTTMILKHINNGSVFVINLWKNNYTKHEEIHNLSRRNRDITYLIYRSTTSGNIIYFIMSKEKLYQQTKTIELFVNTNNLPVTIPLSKMLRGIEMENNIILRQSV